MGKSGNKIVIALYGDIIDSFRVDQFRKLSIVTNVVRVAVTPTEIRIMKKWKDWFTEKEEPWIVTKVKDKNGTVIGMDLWKRDVVIEENQVSGNPKELR